MAAFVLLLLFGHRDHKAAILADPLRVAAKYEAPSRYARIRFSHRAIMALSTVGYTTSAAGTAAANGNYVPVVGANATLNGATQYTNGTYYLAFTNIPVAPGQNWSIQPVVNGTYMTAPLYTTPGGNATTFPTTGWVVNNGTATAPTFAVMSGGCTVATVRRRPAIFF